MMLLFANIESVLGVEFKRAAVAGVFAADEAILSDNTDAVLRNASALPTDQQFEYLSEWVLPSISHPGFRMKAKFAPSDANPADLTYQQEVRVEGIGRPVFLLMSVAQETNRLDELRRTVVMLEHPEEPHEQRAKLALLFMIDSASGNREAPLSLWLLCQRSFSSRRARTWMDAGGRKTLALAVGMQHPATGNELLKSSRASTILRSVSPSGAAPMNGICSSPAVLPDSSPRNSMPRQPTQTTQPTQRMQW